MAAFSPGTLCAPLVTPQEVLDCCTVATDAGILPGDPRLLDAIEDASTFMYFALGRTYGGTCPITIRPCISCTCGQALACCCARNAIDVGTLWPVTAILEIWIDGVSMPVGDYHVDEWRYIVSNCNDPWPLCNNLTSLPNDTPQPPLCDPDDERPFEITFEHGLVAPRLVTRAARDMACEFLRFSCLGECLLPERVTSISRRGLSMNTTDPMEFIDKGMTGVYSVDLAVKMLNPQRLQSASFVWSPDLRANRNHRVYT